MQKFTAMGLSQIAPGGVPTPSSQKSVWNKIRNWFSISYQSYVEHYLSQSVDRADFSYREKHLQHKGLL